MNKSISFNTDCFIIYLEGGSFRGIVSRTFISRSGSGMTWSRSMTSDSSFPSLLFWKIKQIKSFKFTVENLLHLIKKHTHRKQSFCGKQETSEIKFTAHSHLIRVCESKFVFLLLQLFLFHQTSRLRRFLHAKHFSVIWKKNGLKN